MPIPGANSEWRMKPGESVLRIRGPLTSAHYRLLKGTDTSNVCVVGVRWCGKAAAMMRKLKGGAKQKLWILRLEGCDSHSLTSLPTYRVRITYMSLLNRRIRLRTEKTDGPTRSGNPSRVITVRNGTKTVDMNGGGTMVHFDANAQNVTTYIVANERALAHARLNLKVGQTRLTLESLPMLTQAVNTRGGGLFNTGNTGWMKRLRILTLSELPLLAFTDHTLDIRKACMLETLELGGLPRLTTVLLPKTTWSSLTIANCPRLVITGPAALCVQDINLCAQIQGTVSVFVSGSAKFVIWGDDDDDDNPPAGVLAVTLTSRVSSFSLKGEGGATVVFVMPEEEDEKTSMQEGISLTLTDCTAETASGTMSHFRQRGAKEVDLTLKIHQTGGIFDLDGLHVQWLRLSITGHMWPNVVRINGTQHVENLKLEVWCTCDDHGDTDVTPPLVSHATMKVDSLIVVASCLECAVKAIYANVTGCHHIAVEIRSRRVGAYTETPVAFGAMMGISKTYPELKTDATYMFL